MKTISVVHLILAENAYGEGVRLFGRKPFLIKKVTDQPEVYRNQALSLGLINARL